MLTLNQVITQITTLAAAHNQIAESGVGDFAEWQAEERNYPILWVFHESTSIGVREMVFSIRLICADRVTVGEEGDDNTGMEQEVLSDTLSVLLDFLAYFQQQHTQDYTVVTTATIDPFTERLNDRLAGNAVVIQIRQPFTWNACQIPQTGATIPPTVDGLTLYDFCDPSVIARLTAGQVACLEAEYGVTCPDSNFLINTVQSDIIPSGSNFNLTVTIGGSPTTPSYNSGTNTMDVTAPSCAAANLQINGVQQETIASGATFDLIATLDGVTGGSYNAGTNTLSFTSNTGWIRNPDWPTMPTPSAEQFIGLLAVFENRTNRMTANLSVAATVDYGDGTSVVSNGTAQLKVWDYATIAATVYVDPVTAQNYKMVFVTITRIATNITDMTFTGNINWLDVAARLPNITLFNFANNRIPLLCQRFVLLSISAGYNPGANDRIVQGMSGLRSLTLPWSTLTAGNVVCNSLGEIDDLGSLTANINLNFSGSRIKKVGTVTINSATNLQSLFDQNTLLQSLTAVIAPAATNAVVLVRSCSRLRGIVTINMPLLQNISQFAQTSPLVDGFIFTNAAAITTTTSAFDGCFNMGFCEMTGLTRGISFATTNIGNYGMSAFANSIGTASGAQTITVTGTPFGALLTALDATSVAIRNVMTGKGFTVAN